MKLRSYTAFRSPWIIAAVSALLLGGAGPSVASAADDVFCAGYAQMAVGQYNAASAVAACRSLVEAQAFRWSGDLDAHRRWCLQPSTTQAAAEAETKVRRDLLRQCQGEAPIVDECDRYATEAVGQERENRARGCGFHTSLWSLEHDYHYAWCVHGDNREQAAAELAERRRLLDEECPTGKGDLAADSWCYEIDEPGPGQKVSITFHPIIENVGSADWYSVREGHVSAEVNVASVHHVAEHGLPGFPHWSIKAGERKVLPGVTVPFAPGNTYTSYGSWTLSHPDDTNRQNDRHATPGVVTGADFLPAAPPDRKWDGPLVYRTCSKMIPASACDAYADLAVAQNEENLREVPVEKRSCGFGPPQWSSDRDYHRLWCERPGTSLGELVAEYERRTEALLHCPGAAPRVGRRPLQVAVEGVRCLEETDEVGADEPYVLGIAIDLAPLVPQVEVTLYGPFEDVDQGETHRLPPTRPAFWGPDGKPRRPQPGQAALLLVLMENDDGDPEAARALAKSTVVASLAASIGLARDLRVKKVIDDVNSIVGLPTGAPNFDQRIDTAKEVELDTMDHVLPWLAAEKTIPFAGDGGRYEVLVSVGDP